jgi:hypothetical protein
MPRAVGTRRHRPCQFTGAVIANEHLRSHHTDEASRLNFALPTGLPVLLGKFGLDVPRVRAGADRAQPPHHAAVAF